MRLRTRVEGGGTPRLTRWGVDSEYGKNLVAACRAEGLKVYDPDVSMIGNGGGAVHRMCQALKRDPVDGR